MLDSTTDQLLAGYAAYTSAEEFGPSVEGGQIAVTPGVIVITTVGVPYEVTRR
ncbi:LxmA leader domain family RiPP [Streptomyces sp. AJS327]|uniref:LxmA leader domain family RiPP n=1 Tax=Streptomyces sp. AJS327 TaxID=2545265 RepID=UPI0015DF049A|nr:LxmA leader domain family RiPP [Streptomyces sp. AJS327]